MANDNLEIDPSINVLRLVENSVKHLEDSQKVWEKNIDDKLNYIKQSIDDKLSYIEQKANVETERVNSLRADDKTAAILVKQAEAVAAQTLAAQTLTNAENLRVSVAKTAETVTESAKSVALQLQQITDQQNVRIAALERAQYVGVGKEGASGNLNERISDLENSKSEIRGVGAGQAMTSSQFRNGILLLGALLSILVVLFELFGK